MSSFIVNFLHKIGVDKAIAYSSGSRIVGGVAGVVSIFFISYFLTGIEQGYYYTFGSIVALQVFFELGLTGIMTQYVAHEASHLKLNENYIYEGDVIYKSRLASLVRFCVKWYSILAAIVFFVLLIAGAIFFNSYSQENGEVSWKIPWILVCIGTSIKLFQSPFTSILTGLSFVKEMSEVSFWQQIIIPFATWIGLIVGLRLYVIGVGYLLSVLVWQVYVLKKRGLWRILVNLWHEEIGERVQYIKEIFPYQWRIALSWVSGYFVFQLFNPVLFATEGAVVAGQMGMTMQVLTAIQALSLSWLNTKIPLFSGFIALKEYRQLDEVFNRTTKQMLCVSLALLSMVFVGMWLLIKTRLCLGGIVLSDRFLPLLPLFLLMIAIYLQQFTNAWATYLRCHKQEPYLALSVCSGLANGLSVILLGHYFGLDGIVVGYCFLAVLFFPWGYIIYKNKKREWHGEVNYNNTNL